MGRKLYNEAGKRKYIWIVQVRQPGLRGWQNWDLYITQRRAKETAHFLESDAMEPKIHYTTRILKYQLVKE